MAQPGNEVLAYLDIQWSLTPFSCMYKSSHIAFSMAFIYCTGQVATKIQYSSYSMCDIQYKTIQVVQFMRTCMGKCEYTGDLCNVCASYM